MGVRESVILQKPANLKVGDVVLAWVMPGRYVVHRIIRIDGEHVTLMGDGNLAGTEHCTIAGIKAIATHVVGDDDHPHSLYTPWRRRAASYGGICAPSADTCWPFIGECKNVKM